MLSPRRAKYRKQFRGRMKGIATRKRELSFGLYGIKSKEAGWLSSRQIEAARRAMTHYTRRGGRIWIRVFPDKPVSKKPAETRMGGGKGDVEEYVARVLPGTVLFEMAAVTRDVAREALRLAAAKLPVKTIYLERET